jgi:phosphoribosylformylglycinamidine synthase
MQPGAVVLRAPGTNRDNDVAAALTAAGFTVYGRDVRHLRRDDATVGGAHLIVIAGGFSYADVLGAGRVFALEIEHRLGDLLTSHVESGRPVLGICNGFQTLVRMGILPGPDMRAALGHNESGRFECRWVTLEAPPSRSVWTHGLDGPIDCPIAHGEGRFVCDDATWKRLESRGQVALRYVGTNPNGSRGDVAGICDESGLVLGMMPHPENSLLVRQHPMHRRLGDAATRSRLGVRLFHNVRVHAGA